MLYTQKKLNNEGNNINWKGSGDTETLFNALICWGIKKTLEECHGMFSFAFWNAQKKIISKSVAIIDNFLSLSCNKTLDKIGKVFFFSTIPCTKFKDFKNISLLIENLINYCSNKRLLI